MYWRAVDVFKDTQLLLKGDKHWLMRALLHIHHVYIYIIQGYAYDD